MMSLSISLTITTSCQEQSVSVDRIFMYRISSANHGVKIVYLQRISSENNILCFMRNYTMSKVEKETYHRLWI